MLSHLEAYIVHKYSEGPLTDRRRYRRATPLRVEQIVQHATERIGKQLVQWGKQLQKRHGSVELNANPR